MRRWIFPRINPIYVGTSVKSSSSEEIVCKSRLKILVVWTPAVETRLEGRKDNQ